MKNRNKVPTQKTKNNSSVFINRSSKKITNFAFMIDEKSSESSLEATPVLASSLHVYLVCFLSIHVLVLLMNAVPSSVFDVHFILSK